MSTQNDDYPVYIKLSNIAIGILAIVYVLYIGQGIILPLIYAAIFAILLNPMVDKLVARGVNRTLSIFIALLVMVAVVSGMVYFISYQIAQLGDTFPQFQEKFADLFKETTYWIADALNTKVSVVKAWIQNAREQAMSNSSAFVGSTLGTLGGLFATIFLLPVYIFFILFYKPLLLEFIEQLFTRDKHVMVAEVLTEAKSLIQNYLNGLMLELVIVAILNSVALLVLGVDYAILLGIVGAILNMIPYIGGIVAIALPMLVALATQSPLSAGLVLAAYSVIQLVDNNIIVPKIVASKVKINALVSIVVVLVGGALWGIPGMFLAIPLTAIVKVVFDRVKPLQAWGYLLGDDVPPIGKDFFKFKRSRKVKET